jgi:hypothetical protein
MTDVLIPEWRQYIPPKVGKILPYYWDLVSFLGGELFDSPEPHITIHCNKTSMRQQHSK